MHTKLHSAVESLLEECMSNIAQKNLASDYIDILERT